MLLSQLLEWGTRNDQRLGEEKEKQQKGKIKRRKGRRK